MLTSSICKKCKQLKKKQKTTQKKQLIRMWTPQIPLILKRLTPKRLTLKPTLPVKRQLTLNLKRKKNQ